MTLSECFDVYQTTGQLSYVTFIHEIKYTFTLSEESEYPILKGHFEVDALFGMKTVNDPFVLDFLEGHTLWNWQ